MGEGEHRNRPAEGARGEAAVMRRGLHAGRSVASCEGAGVHLPRPNVMSLQAEHQVMGLPGRWDAQQQRWNEDLMEALLS